MFPLVPGHGPPFSDQGRDPPPSRFHRAERLEVTPLQVAPLYEIGKTVGLGLDLDQASDAAVTH
jgi:hypothetical protein